MIHPQLTHTLAELGLHEAAEVISLERRTGNWSCLRLRDAEYPSANNTKTSLIWEMVATSAEGPVCELEQISLTVLVTSEIDVGVQAEIRKSWTLQELKLIAGNLPAKKVMLEYLIAFQLLLISLPAEQPPLSGLEI